MACNCGSNGNSGNGPIESWNDFSRTCLLDPRELIAYAKLGTVVGSYKNSSTYITAPVGWATSSVRLGTNTPVCKANGSDNLQNVADADHWNSSHKTSNDVSAVAPPMRKVWFMRGGTMWLMQLDLDFSASTDDNI